MSFSKPITAASALVAGMLMAGAAQAQSVEIRDAVARVVVIPEDRTDIDVQVAYGSAELPRLTITRRGDRVIVDGDLRRRIRNCSGEGHNSPTEMGDSVTVEVRELGRVRVADAPLITIRTPRDIEVEAGGAVWGAIGRADRVELSSAGCGDWTVANVEGELSVSVAGSGDIHAGRSERLNLSVAGSGSVRAAHTGNTDVSIAGSGDVRLAEVEGSLDVSIAGSGDVEVVAGRISTLDASIAGSGDVSVGGETRDADVSIVGSGDVRLARLSGRMDRSIMGSGRVTVGN